MANTKPLKPINIAKRYKHIRPVPRMPNFAAWIEGVDLTRPLSDAVKAELRQALFDFEVIFFRPQKITPQQHIALGKVFGPASKGSYFDRHAEFPELEMIVSDRARPPAIDNWHTDISWKPRPPLGTAIQITVTPPAGGNTCWMSATSMMAMWRGCFGAQRCCRPAGRRPRACAAKSSPRCSSSRARAPASRLSFRRSGSGR